MELDQETHTAFSDAIESGDLEKMADLATRFPQLIDHPDWVPPPLHCAVLWNQTQAATFLVERGADIERRDPDRQTTPLRYAILYARCEMIPVLLRHGALSGCIEPGGKTALELATEAADGVYECFDDLPLRTAYEEVIETLWRWGL